MLRRNIFNLIRISFFALITVFLLHITHLPIETRNALFLLILATGLWVTEAIPPFAVSLLIMGFAVGFIVSFEDTFQGLRIRFNI